MKRQNAYFMKPVHTFFPVFCLVSRFFVFFFSGDSVFESLGRIFLPGGPLLSLICRLRAACTPLPVVCPRALQLKSLVVCLWRAVGCVDLPSPQLL